MKKFLCYDTNDAVSGKINVDSRGMLKPNSTVPSGSAPYQQLVTDGSGNVNWEDRLAYDDSKVIVDAGNGIQYVHVSDDIGELNATDGAKLYFTIDDGSPAGNARADTLHGVGDLLGCICCYIALTDNVVVGSVVFPKRGIYLYKYESEFVSSVANLPEHANETDPLPEPVITWDGNIGEIKKLDEKLLPDTVATKSEVKAAQTTANAALAKFPLEYSDVVDTPFSAVEVPGEVTTYSRSSVKGGTFIELVISNPSDLTGSGFYKVSSDIFDFEDIYKICYKFKYSSGASGNLISVDDLEPKVNFSSDHSVFLINNDILFCGSTGTFTITINGRTESFSVAETGIYSYTCIMSSSRSFVNHIELTKKVSGFIQSGKPVLIPSSTEGSTKKFKITVDDSGTISATEVTS